mmetsp:Transcript_24408/g.34404  ORF Transcript_24408/g.34404 Transcript_24408/m.34404 type:complete len:120 (+) Transcript_24408:836-1195(+)
MEQILKQCNSRPVSEFHSCSVYALLYTTLALFVAHRIGQQQLPAAKITDATTDLYLPPINNEIPTQVELDSSTSSSSSEESVWSDGSPEVTSDDSDLHDFLADVLEDYDSENIQNFMEL